MKKIYVLHRGATKVYNPAIKHLIGTADLFEFEEATFHIQVNSDMVADITNGREGAGITVKDGILSGAKAVMRILPYFKEEDLKKWREQTWVRTIAVFRLDYGFGHYVDFAEEVEIAQA